MLAYRFSFLLVSHGAGWSPWQATTNSKTMYSGRFLETNKQFNLKFLDLWLCWLKLWNITCSFSGMLSWLPLGTVVQVSLLGLSSLELLDLWLMNLESKLKMLQHKVNRIECCILIHFIRSIIRSFLLRLNSIQNSIT